MCVSKAKLSRKVEDRRNQATSQLWWSNEEKYLVYGRYKGEISENSFKDIYLYSRVLVLTLGDCELDKLFVCCFSQKVSTPTCTTTLFNNIKIVIH